MKTRAEVAAKCAQIMESQKKYEPHITTWTLVVLAIELLLDCRDLLTKGSPLPVSCRLCGLLSTSPNWQKLCIKNGKKGHEV